MFPNDSSAGSSGDLIFAAVNAVLCVAFLLCYLYQFFYLAVPFVLKDKAHAPARRNRLGILISARNEAGVIGHLLESLPCLLAVGKNCLQPAAFLCRRFSLQIAVDQILYFFR